MRLLLLRCALLAVLLPLAPHRLAGQAAGGEAGPVTTIVVVRHAEKAGDDPRDPSLTADGELRARALLDVVDGAAVMAIYSTQYRRTRSTVAPLAERLGVPVLVREIAPGGADAYAEALAREILTRNAGQSVVVVGHSNTVPQIVRALSGRAVAEMTEAEYDHLFVVVVPDGGEARLFRARFGAPGAR